MPSVYPAAVDKGSDHHRLDDKSPEGHKYKVQLDCCAEADNCETVVPVYSFLLLPLLFEMFLAVGLIKDYFNYTLNTLPLQHSFLTAVMFCLQLLSLLSFFKQVPCQQ